MRKTMYVLLILLVSVAWAAAQQSNPGSTAGSTSQTSPSSDAGQTGSTATPPSAQSTGSSSSSGQSGASSQATSPSGSASSSTAPGAGTGNEQTVEGCLGGTAPNFTVTDNSGTVYKLGINEGSDTSVLTKHVGESVRVKGNVTGESASASTSTGAAGNSANAASGKTIEVTQIGRGTSVCPTSGAGATSGSGSGSMSGSGSSNPGSSSGPGTSPTPSPK